MEEGFFFFLKTRVGYVQETNYFSFVFFFFFYFLSVVYVLQY